MASAEDTRSETTQRYLSQIRGMVGVTPRLEETELKLLHINTPIEGWREWGVLTYDHNVIGDMLLKENQQLKKKIEALENKIKAANHPPPTIIQLQQPRHFPRSVQVQLPDVDGEDNN